MGQSGRLLIGVRSEDERQLEGEKQTYPSILIDIIVTVINITCSWTKHIQVFGNVELWMSIPLMTFVCGFWACIHIFSTILGGGVGKNGSTVAVSPDGKEVG